jgi:hypothetical protein
MPKERGLKRRSLHFVVRNSLFDILRFLAIPCQIPVNGRFVPAAPWRVVRAVGYNRRGLLRSRQVGRRAFRHAAAE